MSQPIDLFRITMGAEVWTFTSADRSQVYDSGSGDETYVATPSRRSGIEQKNEISKSGLEVTVPSDHPLAISLLTSYNEQIMGLTVFTKDGSVVEVGWKGRLAGIKPGSSDFTMNFESIFTSMRRPGLRARFQRSCRHALYGRGCNLNYTGFNTDSTISDITGTTLTVPAASGEVDGYFTGGMAAATDGALSFITGHVGTQITLQRVNFSLLSDFALFGAATQVKLYPGCDHTRTVCNDKFNNLLNYGGFDWIPTKNPMGGSSIV